MISARTAGPLRGWLAVRHSLRAEAVVVLALWGMYEVARGVVVGDAGEATRHARAVVALERSLHVFVEGRVQNAAHALPGLIDVLGIAYLTLHQRLFEDGLATQWLTHLETNTYNDMVAVRYASRS